MIVVDNCSFDECNQEGSIVVCYSPVYIRTCDEHYNELYKKFLKSRRKVNCNLGQSIHDYVKKDGSRGRLTAGKDWEIAQRTISPDDGKTVINKVTGKETQY